MDWGKRADAVSERAVNAGLVTFGVFLWALVLLLAAGWLAGLFLVILPWSLAAYLALAVAVAVALGTGTDARRRVRQAPARISTTGVGRCRR